MSEVDLSGSVLKFIDSGDAGGGRGDGTGDSDLDPTTGFCIRCESKCSTCKPGCSGCINGCVVCVGLCFACGVCAALKNMWG